MLIRTWDLSKAYERGPLAISRLTLTIGAGIFGLIGPNGAGKTTVMRILTGLVRPTSGRATIGDVPVSETRRIRGWIGYLPQNLDFYPRLNALETLEYFALLSGLKPSRRRLEETLAAVGLADVARSLVGTYSGGMKRRLGLAAAITHEPQILIVDEPTSGLDPEGRIAIRNILSTFSVGRTVVLSTHILGDIDMLAQEVGVLNRGRLVYAGPLERLAAAAEGRVYTLQVSSHQAAALASDLQALSVTYRQEAATLRLLDLNGALPDGAVPAEPTTEDGFVFLLRAGSGTS